MFTSQEGGNLIKLNSKVKNNKILKQVQHNKSQILG